MCQIITEEIGVAIVIVMVLVIALYFLLPLGMLRSKIATGETSKGMKNVWKSDIMTEETITTVIGEKEENTNTTKTGDTKKIVVDKKPK